MKKEINPYIIIGGVTVVVAIIGFFAFKMFFPNPNDTPMSLIATTDPTMNQQAIYNYLGRFGFDAEASKKSVEKFNQKEFEDVAYFEPFYLKDFQGIKKADRIKKS